MTSSHINDIEENSQLKKTLNFSIEHILTKAGNSKDTSDNELTNYKCLNSVAYPWLQCTRYCPPKLPRTQKREPPQKRQLGRHPRIPFTSHQLAILEAKFKQSPYLSSEEVTQVSRSLELADIRVKIWFQNRRARERRERCTRIIVDDKANEHLSSTQSKLSKVSKPMLYNTSVISNSLRTESQMFQLPMDQEQNNEYFSFVTNDLPNSPKNISYSE